jgi:hypothetical protein
MDFVRKKLWEVEHHFWVGLLLHPPKSDEKSVQLPRVSFVKKQLLTKSAF